MEEIKGKRKGKEMRKEKRKKKEKERKKGEFFPDFSTVKARQSEY